MGDTPLHGVLLDDYRVGAAHTVVVPAMAPLVEESSVPSETGLSSLSSSGLGEKVGLRLCFGGQWLQQVRDFPALETVDADTRDLLSVDLQSCNR